jgi:hypothetical protein
VQFAHDSFGGTFHQGLFLKEQIRGRQQHCEIHNFVIEHEQVIEQNQHARKLEGRCKEQRYPKEAEVQWLDI